MAFAGNTARTPQLGVSHQENLWRELEFKMIIRNEKNSDTVVMFEGQLQEEEKLNSLILENLGKVGVKNG